MGKADSAHGLLPELFARLATVAPKDLAPAERSRPAQCISCWLNDRRQLRAAGKLTPAYVRKPLIRGSDTILPQAWTGSATCSMGRGQPTAQEFFFYFYSGR
jgi:hypothetical protein